MNFFTQRLYPCEVCLPSPCPSSFRERGIYQAEPCRYDTGRHPHVSHDTEGAHLPVVITVQVTTDGQHGTSQAEALGCCGSKRVWRLVDQAGIEVEGWGVGAGVDRRHLEAEEREPSHGVRTGATAPLAEC